MIPTTKNKAAITDEKSILTARRQISKIIEIEQQMMPIDVKNFAFLLLI